MNYVTGDDLSLLQKVFGEYHIDFSLYTHDLNIDEVLMFLKYVKDCDNLSFNRIINYKNTMGYSHFYL